MGRIDRKERFKVALCLSLTALVACAPVQPQAQQYAASPPVAPVTTHFAASGCAGEHDTLSLPGGLINAYPAWPPNAQPEHIVLHYNNGTTVWGKASYGSADCTDYMSCRRATFILNPAWKQCAPQGHVYEVVTLDGEPVLESGLLQVIDPPTKATVYIGFACARGFAGQSVTSLIDQIRQSGCLSQASAASAAGAPAGQGGHPYLKAAVEVIGVTLAAAAVLGTAYFGYRASMASAQAESAAAMNAQLFHQPSRALHDQRIERHHVGHELLLREGAISTVIIITRQEQTSSEIGFSIVKVRET